MLDNVGLVQQTDAKNRFTTEKQENDIMNPDGNSSQTHTTQRMNFKRVPLLYMQF